MPFKPVGVPYDAAGGGWSKERGGRPSHDPLNRPNRNTGNTLTLSGGGLAGDRRGSAPERTATWPRRASIPADSPSCSPSPRRPDRHRRALRHRRGGLYRRARRHPSRRPAPRTLGEREPRRRRPGHPGRSHPSSALRRSASRSGFERAPPSAPAAERGRELIARAELQAEIAALEARLVWGSHHRRRRHRPGPRWPRIDLLGLRRERSSMGQPK